MNLSSRARADQTERSPLWLQVRNGVLALIREQGLTEHARLPSETELCARFGVSRIVVREAMGQLVAARLIYRQQGRGAFVASRDDGHGFVGTAMGYSGELEHDNHVVQRRILRQELTLPDERVRRFLGLGVEDHVVQLDRVMVVDGTPRIRVITSLPAVLVPGLASLPMERRSLHETLRQRYGVTLRKAQRWLKAKIAEPALADSLQLPEGAPLLEIESRATILSGQAAEYYVAHYRTDQARLSLTIG